MNMVSNYDNLKILCYVDVEFPDVWHLAINFVLESTDSLDTVGIVIGNLERIHIQLTKMFVNLNDQRNNVSSFFLFLLELINTSE